MARKFIPFEQVEQLATIEQLAEMLNLPTHRYGKSGQLRCACPVHGGKDDAVAISPNVRSKRGSVGVFYCQVSQQGGDRIGLVAHCMEMGQQEAAFFIHAQLGEEEGTVDGTVTNSTVSNSRADNSAKKSEAGANRPAKSDFNPDEFAEKLAYGEAVEALGLSEQAAAQYRIGVRRGKLYLPICPPGVTPAGFAEFYEGKLRLPDKWLSSNVVPLGVRKTA